MSIYHLHIKILKRSEGHNLLAAAAYRGRTRLTDHAKNQTHDYSKKQNELIGNGLVVPANFAYASREDLWNDAERLERRGDARLGREILVALPHELELKQQVELTRKFSTELVKRYGVPVDFAIHTANGDERNFHAHLLIPSRRIGESGKLDKKTRELDIYSTGIDEVKWMRKTWEAQANEYLDANNQIDCRSLKDRRIQRPKQPHYGNAIIAWERKNKQDHPMRIDYETELERWDSNQDIAQKECDQLLAEAASIGVPNFIKTDNGIRFPAELLNPENYLEMANALRQRITDRKAEQETQQLKLEATARKNCVELLEKAHSIGVPGITKQKNSIYIDKDLFPYKNFVELRPLLSQAITAQEAELEAQRQEQERQAQRLRMEQERQAQEAQRQEQERQAQRLRMEQERQAQEAQRQEQERQAQLEARRIENLEVFDVLLPVAISFNCSVFQRNDSDTVHIWNIDTRNHDPHSLEYLRTLQADYLEEWNLYLRSLINDDLKGSYCKYKRDQPTSNFVHKYESYTYRELTLDNIKDLADEIAKIRNSKSPINSLLDQIVDGKVNYSGHSRRPQPEQDRER